MSVETKTTTCHTLNEVGWGKAMLQPVYKWAPLAETVPFRPEGQIGIYGQMTLETAIICVCKAEQKQRN